MMKQESKHKMKTIVEQLDDRLDYYSLSSSVSSSVVLSSESDSMPQQVTSSDYQLAATGPLNDMSSLLQQLPIKRGRGLSKHYEGKSRTFTSLSKVRCIEDLAKEDDELQPYNKKLKLCKRFESSCGHSNYNSPSVISSKKSRPASCSSLPIPPHTHRSTNTTTISNQTALFA